MTVGLKDNVMESWRCGVIWFVGLVRFRGIGLGLMQFLIGGMIGDRVVRFWGQMVQGSWVMG